MSFVQHAASRLSAWLIRIAIVLAATPGVLLPGALFAQGGQDAPLQLKERRLTLVVPETTQRAKQFHGVRYKANAIPAAKAHGQHVTPICSSPHASYFGGPVISNVQPVVVFWNSDVNAALTDSSTGIAKFLGDLTQSTFMGVLSQYSTYGTNLDTAGTNQWIGNGSSSVSAYTITPAHCAAGSSNCTVTDAEIQTELQAQISSNVLPAPVYDSNGYSNTLYMTYFPAGVKVSGPDGAGNSCVGGGFCAYHNTGGSIAAPLSYGVLMDEFTSACASGCGVDATDMENQTSTTSHEFAEAVSDTEIGLDTGNDYAYPAAWGDNDNGCGEIADICDASAAGDQITVSGRNWIVQELWSNEDSQCESSGTVNLPFAFAAPSTATTGTSFNLTVTAQNPSGGTNTGYRGTVHFSSSDASATLPANYIFVAADAGVHTFHATLATASTQTITVTDEANTNLTADVSVVASQGQIAVPAVVGDTQAAATSAITGAGLTVGTVSTQSSSTIPSGDVISQSPAANTLVDSGSAVNLVISTGPAQVSVPTVVGQTQAAATTAITTAGLVVGTVTAASSNTVTAGKVISQSPTGGTLANAGSAVNLVVSSGPLKYLLTVVDSPAGGGSVSPSGGTYLPNTVVTLTATPALGYVFAGWSGPVSSTTGNPTKVTMKAAETVTAKFKPAITVSPSSIDFGTVYLSSVTYKTVTVTNSGSQTLKITNPVVGIVKVGDSREFLAENLCSTSLAPHKTCTIRISFVAGAFYHQQSATLGVTDNSSAPAQPVTLTALTIDPEVKLSVSSISFGSQKSKTASAAKAITLTNPGATTLTIHNISIGGSNLGSFSETNHCPGSLSAGASCTISVTFKPVSTGAKSAKLNITDNAKNSPQSISLSGTGK